MPLTQSGGDSGTTVDRLPDFIIIGAMKAGTTTLYQYLCRHPAVYMCKPKEPMCFSHDQRYDRGIGWYRSLFADAALHQVCGEASTSYSRWPHFPDVPARIKDHGLSPRLIYIMRHPVERAYSHYVFLRDVNRTLSFEHALDKHPAVVDAGLYLRQIERFLRFFSSEQMLLLLLDDLKRDPPLVCRKLFEFIGVDPDDLEPTTDPIIANTRESYRSAYLRSRIVASLRKTRGIGILKKSLPPGVKNWVVRVLPRMSYVWNYEARRRIPEMAAVTRSRLIELYREPNRRLSQFLGRDLSHWNH